MIFKDLLLQITIVLVALFASPKYTYEFSVPKYAILTLSISILFTYLAVKWIKEKKISFYISTAHVIWFFFAIVSIISSFNVLRYNPFYFRQSFDIGLYVLFNVLVAFYISSEYKEKNRINLLLFVFMITGFIISIDALLNFYTGYDFFLGKVGAPFTRASIKASVGNVIFAANYIDMLLPIALYFLLAYNMNLTKSWQILVLKIFALISFLTGFVAVIVSQTRSEYLAIIIMSVMYVMFYFIWKKGKKYDSDRNVKKLSNVLFAILIVASIFLVVIYNTENPLTGQGKVNMTKRFEAMSSVSSKDERFLSWFTSLELWEDHKIFGSGIGTYQLLSLSKMGEYLEKHPELYYGWNNFKRAHNDYFQVLGETGTVGFVLIVLLLVILVYYFFTIPKKIDERDDLLLFLSLSISIVGFAIQSFFSFPGHLLPNALAATVFASLAIGPYFTKRKLKEVTWGKAILISILVLTVSYSSTYLRWNHFISEVYFKDGNAAYLTFAKIIEEYPKASEYISSLESKLDALEKQQGEFSYLNKKVWEQQKIREYKNKNIPFNEFEIENQRIAQIENIRKQLKAQLEKIKMQKASMPALAKQYYIQAKEKLLKSVKINHTYGKSYFYLATLAVQEFEIENLKKNLYHNYKEIFNQEFSDFQKVVKVKHKWLSTLIPYIEKNKDILDKFDFATTQALIDSISLYETSLLCFNERNTYKALAMRFHNLHIMMRKLLSLIGEKQYKEKVKKLVVLTFDKYVEYAKKTIINMPGGWNRFPDWKNPNITKASRGEDIYRFFAGMIFKLQPPTVEPVSDFIYWLANMEIKAVKYMNLKGIWGVPNGVIDFLHASAFEYYKNGMIQEAIYLLEKLKDMYKSSYDMAEKQLSKYKRSLDNQINYLKEKYGKKIEDILAENSIPNSAIKVIKDEFERALDNANRDFQNYNYLSVETNYMKKVVSRNPSSWYDVPKNSVWGAIIVKHLNEFLSKLQKMGVSTNIILSIREKIQNLINNPTYVSVYESYARFITHYALIGNDLKFNAKKLLEKYSEITDNMWKNVIDDWSNVLFDATPLYTKEEIFEYLKSISK
ncbi:MULTISPECIES: O-antigen ligase family protein [unclassified Thermosipho (in: thermotogales)]|uniref:O-antigen ligase family protein n=1 Tax=unclassified Thermosipho (in: thermotogales) TaxID=2676525 RepID=UPI000986C501|nr:MULTISPECIES: O-antigen ligase family protein [unclassified Thermosipho (in: thermotogales)]MBT1247286.1 polymerase [Thermosipho sp. 1244]OOC47141.1 polymerase [Thermosipho sp. 1223]